MRICVVGPSYPFRGGISHYTSLLCKNLSARHEVKLVSLKRQYPSLLFPGKTQVDTSDTTIQVDGAEPIVDSINPLSWIRAAKTIRRFKPDIVILQWWHPFFAFSFGSIARRVSRCSTIMFICHNVVPHEKSGPMMKISKAALKWGDLFVVHSEEDMTNLRSMMPMAKAKTARHPTYDVFNYQEIGKNEARDALGLPNDKPVVLFFGLVRQYKGLQYLIQAMPKVVDAIGAKLVVAGEFYDNKESYTSQIESLGLVDSVVVRDEYVPNEKVGLFFSAADVVVLPYVTATQSGIVQIAFGFRKPVITTNVGGLPEAVKDGMTGMVVPPENPEAIADAIIRFFREDLGPQMSASIRANESEFSWDRMVETIEELSGGSQML